MSKKLALIINITIVICIVSIFSCCDSSSDSLIEQYPSLRVANQYEGRSIKSVTLVGYEFNNLNIVAGDSQLFALDSGMPGGYQNINITVIYGSGPARWSTSNSFNFTEGSTTNITLRGSSAEGHPDYNNTRLE